MRPDAVRPGSIGRRRFWRTCLVSAGLLAVLAAPAVWAEELTIYADNGYEPLTYLKEGQPQGVLVEIMRRAETITGDHYEIVLVPWRRAYEMARRGEGGVMGLSYTTERALLFDYSLPMAYDTIHLVTLKGKEFHFEGLDDLAGKLVGAVFGASYGKAVDQRIAQGAIKVNRDTSHVSMLRKLLYGQLDAVFIGGGAAGMDLQMSRSTELQEQRGKFAVLPVPVVRDPLYLAFPRSLNKAAALQRFNRALAQLGADPAKAARLQLAPDAAANLKR